jgi:hypothetical protein
MVIVSYREQQTTDFSAGTRVKALSGIERPDKSPGPTNVEIVDYH